MNLFKIKRNKLNRQEAFNFEKRSRFGIRKLTIGVVSLAIGSGMVLNAAEQVYAGTDFDSGEIRHVRNGSPKEMAEGSAVPGTIAEKANYRDYKIETVPVVENGVQYVDVTLTFNERGRAYSKNRFYVFNMPSSLYEPKVITREVYQQAVQESQSSVGSQTYTDYKIVASQKISTLTTSGWREEPTNVAPGTDRWGVNYRYINGNPESSDYNKGNNTMRQIIGPGNNNSGEAISWIYTSKGAYDGDWDRLISHSFDGKAEVVNNFKNKSNSIYIEQARHSREKVVYKFRARVKDPNADMNFIFGMNEMIANGHANFLAKYGKTPDNRKYSERFSVNTPAKITVDNTSNLTRDNKLAIIAKIKEANSSLFGSDNSLKTPILVEPTENDIPTNATSGNITLRYTDGSTTTIPVANTVRQKVVATNNPAPRVVTALTYDAAKNSATKTENGQRTRIQLPDKLGVTDLGQIANPTAKIDPVNSATTAENLWNAQLNALRAKNLGTGGTFATNTYINNIGSASDPTENNGLYDMSATSRFALSLKKSSTGQIEGILVKGPNADNNAQVDVGLITADMLFKNVSSIEPARQSARQEIDNLGNIDGKDGWKNEINNAGTEAEIQAVVDKAKRAKAEFDKKKDAVKAKIDALTTLTPEQKEQFKQRVDNTTQSHMLEVPYEDAKKAGLAKEKEQAIALINSLEHLPATGSPSKQESIEWINDPWIVPDSATLNNEVTDALINNAKIKAKKELDAMNPAPSNLAELKRQIDAVTKESAKAQGKTGQEIIEAIVEKAKTDALKEQAKKDIAAVPGLSAEKKKEYQDKVDAATNVRDLEQIVSEAKAHAEYETAKQTIQGLPNLNNAQKAALLASLDDDKTQAGIAATLDEARQQDSDMARLKELQDQAEQLKNSSAYRDGQPDKKKALDDALNASKLITPSNGQRPTVDLGQMIKNLEDGIKGLGSDPVARTVDKSSLNAEIERENSVKAQNNYSYQNASEDKKQAYQTALQEAQAVANNQQATQDQVNAATDKLRNARLALDGHAPDRVQDTLADSTDLVVPKAVQIKGTTVAEDEKQTIIDALKAANTGKLPEDTGYEVASNGAVTVTYNDNSSEVVNVPLKSGIPTVTTQPHDLVVFKNTDMTTPVELAGFADNESISDVQIVSTNGRTQDEMDLTVGEKDKENNTKAALISGKTGTSYGVGKHTRKLRALDNLGQASAATNDFYVRVVDATVNQPETAIEKAFGQSLTPEDVRPKINFNVGSGQDNMIDFEVIIPADAPTSGQNKDISVIIRTKAHANAPENFKQTFVSQDKTVTVRATWPTQADNIEVTAPADTTPVLIDGARPTSEADKTALIDALKEANKTPEGTSKFPENTRFDVAENGAVTITYPDRSSETVTVPFKQKDSAQHTPTVAETPINSAATAGTPLTEDERNAVKAAVTVPNFPGDRQPTVTVPENARVTNGTEGNTGKPVVVATVEYPDGSSETVEVPVKQRDNAKYEATISNPETPAAIKASHASDTAITDEADKNAILAKVSVPEGSSGRPSLDQNPVVEERDGKQVVKVTVTYPDQTTDTVYVPVDQKDNETHNPTAPAESVKLDAPATANSTLSDDDKAAVKAAVTVPDGSRGEVSLPEGAKVELVGDKPVVKATVTYPDGTTDIVDVPVVQKDSTKYDATASTTPVPLDSPVTPGQTLSAEEREALKFGVNVPAGSNGQIHVPENAAVKLDGDKPVVEAEVRYPDGTVDKVQVPVRQYDRAVYTPNLVNPKEVPISVEPTNDTQITSPDDAAILANVDVPAAGTKPEVTKTIASPVKDGTGANQGKKVVEVEITYPDKSKEKIEVPVKHADNQVHNPEAPTKPVQLDVAATTDTSLSDADKQAVKDAVTIPQGSGGVASLPEDAKVVDRNGTPVVPVTVTYPDGTTETVDVPVVQKDSTKHTPVLTEANSPVLTDTPAKANEPVQETDKAAIAAKVDKTNLPQGTETKVPDDAVVELENGKPVVPVLVSYPDGTSETIKVPVDQKDDLTYNPVAPNKDNAVAITSPQTPGTEITDPTDKAAILDSVTVPAVDGGQAPKVTKEITSPVKVVDGKAFVEVTVTYPDKTSEVIPVPVNQKDNEANTPTVTAPEKPAPISVPVAENTPVETDADKKLITDKVNVAGLPNPPQSVKVAEPAKVVLDQAGNPVVNVEVTYPDGTKDIVPVPVKQADNQTNTPSLKDPEVGKPAEVLVAIDPTPGVAINNPMDKEAIAAKVDLSKLPAGTTAEVADGAVVANDPLTNKPVVPVTVTYPDGTSETINVPVKQADNLAMDPSLKDTNPVPILTEATVGLTVSDKANLDAIAAKVDPKTGKAEVVNNTIVAGKEDGPHAGQPVVNVLVTYPDGTQDTIEVPVKQADNVANEPSLTDQTPVPIQAAATTGTPVPADDKPAILAKVNLPEGAEATIADDATVIREDGQAVVPVTVTYPDGTTDTISVPVKRADNSKYTPSQVTDTVQVDAATAPGTAITSQDDKDAIIAAVTVPKVAAGEKAPVVSLPENPQVEVVNAQPVVKAIVTYADGTTDTVDVPIVQKVSATKEPSLKETEPGKPAQAVITENPTAGASITDPADQNVILDKVVVPEGGKASIADDAVVEMDGDQPVLPVTVTYTDGSKDIIKVPVKQADNVAKEPSLKSQTPVGVMDAPAVGAQVEEPADLEAIKNNVDTKGGTASIEDPTIVEGPNNQPAVAVKVTYPDGTADTILVPIKTADNVTYTPVLKSTDPVLVSVATDNGTAVPEADQAKILANVDVPALTADGDKPAVDLSIENPVVLQKNGQAGVEVTVTYQDGSKDKIFVPVDTDTDKDGFSNKEEEKAGTSATDPASTPAGQDSAERLNPGLTEPVEVKNPDKLTDAEKEAVKKAVEDSNDLPAGTTVSVANDGTVTVTYPDNSTDTIKPKDAVTQFVDTDGDGISDRQETENGTDPSKVDSDNDGFSDKEEVERGTDPTKADSKPASSETDTDGDGISNEDEVARGTDPNKSDTDGDGFSDQEEITAGSNPTKADSTPANVDKDGDGFTDTEEAAAGTDANNPASTPAGQDSADRLNPGLTEPVEVKNPDKLTDAEKESVKKAVEDSNDLPEGTEVTVSDNGTVTVTYPDKST
ncbi:TPA: Rib/alpha-like domain-containing protein, partial [Streptococcus suis]